MRTATPRRALGRTGPGLRATPRRAPGRTGLALLAAAVPLLATACASGPATRPPPAGTLGPGWTEEGMASWYGSPFHGRATASGETYDMEAMTAAHPWMPFGTVLRVENRDNGRRAVVRINDRGPFARRRILDVSRAAARALGMLGPGTARVRLRVESLPGPPSCLEVQVGAFGDPAHVRRATRELEESGIGARTEPGPGGLVRVVAGPFGDLDAARALSERRGGIVRACPGGG